MNLFSNEHMDYIPSGTHNGGSGRGTKEGSHGIGIDWKPKAGGPVVIQVATDEAPMRLSHSTRHSEVQPMEDVDRYTLRLLKHI